MKYRKKPVVIEAIQFTGGEDNRRAVLDFTGLSASNASTIYWRAGAPDAVTGNMASELVIRTLEGDLVASHGDWIIRGVKGELYPCKPDIFDATYEPAENSI